jgi:CheY-like chemotaxis protein
MSNRSRILIVDDNPTNIAILEEMLEADYLLETAESGMDTLEIAPIFNPDLILLDVMMPGLDGYETVGVYAPVRS